MRLLNISHNNNNMNDNKIKQQIRMIKNIIYITNELNKIDAQITNKYKKNDKYILFLNSLIDESNNNIYTIIKNLDSSNI